MLPPAPVAEGAPIVLPLPVVDDPPEAVLPVDPLLEPVPMPPLELVPPPVAVPPLEVLPLNWAGRVAWKAAIESDAKRIRRVGQRIGLFRGAIGLTA
jgi:hypothetical protein